MSDEELHGSASVRSARAPWRARLSPLAPLLLAATLLVGLLDLVVSPPTSRPLSWLVVLFRVNAGLGPLPPDPLRAIYPSDIVILLLAAAALAGLWPVLARRHRVWMGLAITLPLAGIVLLLVTRLAGRSSLMGAGFVVAVLMITDRRWRSLAPLGIFANASLLAGDVITTGARAPVIAAAFGIGYVTIVSWYLLIAWRQRRQLFGRPPRGI